MDMPLISTMVWRTRLKSSNVCWHRAILKKKMMCSFCHWLTYLLTYLPENCVTVISSITTQACTWRHPYLSHCFLVLCQMLTPILNAHILVPINHNHRMTRGMQGEAPSAGPNSLSIEKFNKHGLRVISFHWSSTDGNPEKI